MQKLGPGPVFLGVDVLHAPTGQDHRATIVEDIEDDRQATSTLSDDQVIVVVEAPAPVKLVGVLGGKVQAVVVRLSNNGLVEV